MVLINREYISVEFSSAKLRQRNKSLSVLLDINNFLSTSLGLDEVLSGALSKVLEHFAFRVGRVYLLDETGQLLNLAAYQGMDTKGLEQLSIMEGFSGKAARTHSFIAQYVSELEDKERAAILMRQGLNVIVCVPLLISEQVIGVMNLAAEKTISLNQASIDLLIAVGNTIAIAANHARLRGDLEQAVQDIREKKDTIEFFAHTASHDLKSPTIAIHGLAALLQRKYHDRLDEKGRAYCSQILSAAEQVAALVDAINAYLRSREAHLFFEKLRIKEIIECVAHEFCSTLSNRHVGLSVPKNLPEVIADRLSLTRVFRNLVENALKHGGESLGEIRIEHTETPDHHVFSVSDDGAGLNPDESPDQLFNAFHKRRTSKGAGLGLAIVKEIAERHQGDAWVKGGTVKGVSFYVSISKSLRE